jgi:hypothetical protein
VPDVLGALGLTGGAASDSSVACPGGGSVATREVRAAPYSGDLRAVLRRLPGIEIIVDEDRLFAFRAGTAEVAVRAHADTTILTTTTVCG